MGALLNVFGGNRPDITPAQLLGALAAGVGPVCTLAGIDLSREQLTAVDDLKVIGLGLIGADAVLRIGRNVKDGRVEAAGLARPGEPPLGPVPGNGPHEPPLPDTPVPVEAPLELDEIEGVDADAELTDDLDEEAQAIEDEELSDIPPEDERP